MFVGDLFTIQSFLQSKTTIVFHLLQGTFMPPKNRELLNQNDFISTPSGMRTGQSKIKKKVVKFHTDEVDILEGDVKLFRTPASGDVWQMRYLVRKEGKYFRKSTRKRDLTEAKEVAKQNYYSIMGLMTTGRKIFSLTTTELVKLYLQHQQRRVDDGHITQGRYGTIKAQTKQFLLFVGKNESISNINDKKYRQYYRFRKDRSPSVQNTTLINERATIGSLYKFGIEEGYIAGNQVPKWEEMSKKGRKREHLPVEAYRCLYKYLNKWDKSVKDKRLVYERKLVRDFIYILANTGLRLGEARQLKWNMVSVVTGKNKYPNVKIIVPAEISKVKHKGDRTAIGMRGDIFNRIKGYSISKEAGDFVFPEYTNPREPINRDVLYKLWKEIRENSGIIDYEVGLPYTYYCLRHTFATYRLNFGNVDVFTLSSIMGCSVKYIEDHYGHPDVDKRMDYITRKNTTYDDVDTLFVGDDELPGNLMARE